jgi:hypothetical protein
MKILLMIAILVLGLNACTVKDSHKPAPPKTEVVKPINNQQKTKIDFIGEIPPVVDSVVGNILSYAVLLAAIATITMTFLELIKAMGSLRAKYHERSVADWLHSKDTFIELLVLSVADVESSKALFDQPTDKMMGQIQAATNVAIDFPDLYPNLYDFLTRVPQLKTRAHDKGVKEWGFKNHTEDKDVWQKFISKEEQSSENEVAQATKARARIDHFVSRKLDAFQTRTEYIWARRNQYYAVSAASCFLYSLLLYRHVPIFPAFILAVFGGMISPLAKDVVSALSGLRTK